MNNKDAIDLSLSFIRGNWTLSLSALTILIIIYVLSVVPLLDIFALSAYSLFLASIQIYVARGSINNNTKEQMESFAQNSSLKSLFFDKIQIAIGSSLGFFIIGLIFLIIFGVAFSFTPYYRLLQNQNLTTLEILPIPDSVTVTILLVVFLALMWFGYLYPAVAGEVFRSNTLKDAFLKSFLTFSPSFWKRCLSGEYFKLVAIWSITVFLVALVCGLLFQTLILIPVALVGWYWLSLYSGIVFIHSTEKLK